MRNQHTLRIFISATTIDLASYREAVAEELRFRELVPVEQRHFGPTFRTVEHELTQKLRSCDAVICLVGIAYGEEPKDRPARQLRQSYTQMEYRLARKLRKPVFVFIASDGCRFDNDIRESADKASIQQGYRHELRTGDALYVEFNDKVSLTQQIGRIKFGDLARRSWAPTRTLVASVAILGSIAVMIAAYWIWNSHSSFPANQNDPQVSQQKALLPQDPGFGVNTSVRTTSQTFSVMPRQNSKEDYRPLFNGLDLAGWEMRNPVHGRSSWRAHQGTIVNSFTDKDHSTDLVTTSRFKDFTLEYEYRIPANSNSGVFLRGCYEIQILDNDAYPDVMPIQRNGAVYKVAIPLREPPCLTEEWHKVQVTLVGNRITAFLNGVLIHDNTALGEPYRDGGLANSPNGPGPIILQGTFGSVAFRNLRIRPLD